MRCKKTSVSHLVVKLHSQYRCSLVPRTPCACSSAVDSSVLIVDVRKCIVVSGSVSALRPLLGGGGGRSFGTLLFPKSLMADLPACVQVLEAFFLACAESRKNS